MCHPHYWMTGTVHVVARGEPHTSNQTVEIYQRPDGTMGYTPQNITVQVGDPVRWVNTGHASHSLMDTKEMEEHGGTH